MLLVFKTNFKQVKVCCLFLSQRTVQMWPQQEYTKTCEPPLAVYLEDDLFFLRASWEAINTDTMHSNVFFFYLFLEYKRTEREIGLILFLYGRLHLPEKEIWHHNTNTLQGRSMFKNMVVFWMPEEKRSLFIVKLCSVKVTLKSLIILHYVSFVNSVFKSQ